MKLELVAIAAIIQFVLAKEPWDDFKHIKASLFANIVTFHIKNTIIAWRTKVRILILLLMVYLLIQACHTEQGPDSDRIVSQFPSSNILLICLGISQGSRHQDPANAWSHFWEANPYAKGVKILDCGDIPVITVDNQMS